jgi:hypothetical protein
MLLRVQEFGGGVAVGRLPRRLEEGGRHVERHELGICLDQEIFLLEADGERAGHPEALLLQSCDGGVIHGALPKRVRNAIGSNALARTQGQNRSPGAS